MRRILVVDHDSLICKVIRMGLEADRSFRVTAVSDAQEAIAVIADDPPDAVIVDTVFPRDAGLGIVRRALDGGVPVLLITGHPDTQEMLAQAGCHFLRKPFRIETLRVEASVLLDDATHHRTQLALSIRSLIEDAAALP
jgi:DNA-binding response OmpR family regulator